MAAPAHWIGHHGDHDAMIGGAGLFVYSVTISRKLVDRIPVRMTISLLASLTLLYVSCLGDAGNPSADPVSLARLRQGEKSGGECVFSDDLSQYPVTYSGVSENCLQAVTIGPLSLADLDQMQREEPSFWKKSSPYQQSLVGEWFDAKCQFTSPAVQAVLEFSETVSTDWANCIMIVEVGPVTKKQIEKVERLGSRSRTPARTAVPPRER